MLVGILLLQYLWCITFTMYRYGFSTVENSHAIGHTNEKTSEHTIPTYVALINYEETHDCVSKQYAYKPDGKSPPVKYRNLIEHVITSEKHGMVFNKKGKYYRNKLQAKPDDSLSLDMFQYILEEMFKSPNWKGKKCAILMEQNGLSYLWFPDDLIIFATNRRTLLNIVSELQHETTYAGLAINQRILANYAEQMEMHLKKKPHFYMEESVYLGKFIAYSKRSAKALNRRVSLSRKNFWVSKFGLRDRMRAMEKIGSVMDIEVTSCLANNCEVWFLTSGIMQKLIHCRRLVSYKSDGKTFLTTEEELAKMLNNWNLARKNKWRQRMRWENGMIKSYKYGPKKDERNYKKKEEKERVAQTEQSE